MTDNNNKLPNIFENGGLVAIYDLKLEQEEPSLPEDLSFTNLSKRNLEKTTVDNSEQTRATKQPKPHKHCSRCTFSSLFAQYDGCRKLKVNKNTKYKSIDLY